MVFDPLATAADLTARNILVPAGMFADGILAGASDAVRDAAECPISVATSTVTLVIDSTVEDLDLPGGPVSSVDTVVVGGVTVPVAVLTGRRWSPGWQKLGNSIRFHQWPLYWATEADITYTHGYPVVPADIVDLVCSMAAMAMAGDGAYGSASRTTSIKLGDFSESFMPQPDLPSPVMLPEATREALRCRFGTTVAVIKASR